LRLFSSKRTDDFHGGGGEVGGLDAPGLGIEVVGAVADVLDRTEGDTLVGDGDDAARGVGWENEGFAAEVAESVLIREIDFCFVECGVWIEE
jgi:hypothetical protein